MKNCVTTSPYFTLEWRIELFIDAQSVSHNLPLLCQCVFHYPSETKAISSFFCTSFISLMNLLTILQLFTVTSDGYRPRWWCIDSTWAIHKQTKTSSETHFGNYNRIIFSAQISSLEWHLSEISSKNQIKSAFVIVKLLFKAKMAICCIFRKYQRLKMHHDLYGDCDVLWATESERQSNYVCGNLRDGFIILFDRLFLNKLDRMVFSFF